MSAFTKHVVASNVLKVQNLVSAYKALQMKDYLTMIS